MYEDRDELQQMRRNAILTIYTAAQSELESLRRQSWQILSLVSGFSLLSAAVVGATLNLRTGDQNNVAGLVGIALASAVSALVLFWLLATLRLVDLQNRARCRMNHIENILGLELSPIYESGPLFHRTLTLTLLLGLVLIAFWWSLAAILLLRG